MKVFLFVILSLFPSLNRHHSLQQPAFKIATFTDVPDYIAGCGNGYYLSTKDKKTNKLICWTDFVTLIAYINNKPVLLKVDNERSNHTQMVYTSGGYSIIIKELSNKQTDTEYYILTAVITIKYAGKIIWQQKVVGDGGC